MKIVFLPILFAVILSVSLAFQPRINTCRVSTRLYSDEADKGAGKGFGKKKAVMQGPEQKQPFNSRLNPTTDAAEGSVVSRSEEKNLYVTPRARREAELDDKIARLKEEEDLISSDTSVGAVPELVADRMIGRIVAFFGIPVFGGTAQYGYLSSMHAHFVCSLNSIERHRVEDMKPVMKKSVSSICKCHLPRFYCHHNCM
jgi:hypothetical protein